MGDESLSVKILLAEDNQSLGLMYKHMMMAKGMRVDHVIDGQQAWDAIRKGGYDLVLLDIRMPVMDGLQVLEKLKAEPSETPNGPVVMLTNLTEEALVQKAISLGALSYVDKSNLNPEELVSKIIGVLGLPMPDTLVS